MNIVFVEVPMLKPCIAYTMALVEFGESKKEKGTATIAESPLKLATELEVKDVLLPVVTPIPTAVESLMILKEPNGTSVVLDMLITPLIRTLDDAALGVMVAVSPARFPVKLNAATLSAAVSVLVVDTTCNTFPRVSM